MRLTGAMDDTGAVELVPDPCLVVLVGPSSAGKSHWAAQHFEPEEVLSSDQLRAVVGRGTDDLDATTDAFALLDTIVEHRLGRRLVTVVDTLGLDDGRRQAYRERAGAHGVPCIAVGFDVPAAEIRRRNRERGRPLPADAITQQLVRWTAVRDALDGEGFERVLRPTAVRIVPPHAVTSADTVTSADAVSSAPVADAIATTATPRGTAPSSGLTLGLHVSAFPWASDQLPGRLGAVAAAAEATGFAGLWVMDHLRQIPQVGRDWDPMLEPYATLAWLAAATTTVRLGTLVTPVTFRNVGVLAKAIATIDVLSAGRITCGLGLGWYEREHRAVNLDFPTREDRYELLEDALEVLPLLWGPGSPAFRGRRIEVPEAIGYPRPVQPRIPILVGGGGERRTLRLAARHADAVNVMGDPETVARKVAVLRRHCDAIGRDPGEIAVTVLAPTLLGRDRSEVRALVDRLRPARVAPDRYAASVHAGTPEDQRDRLRAYAAAGADEVIVSLPALGLDGLDEDVAAIAAFAPLVDRPPTG